MHLCRIDLTLAVYGGLSLHQRQRFWTAAVKALSEGRRKKRRQALVCLGPKIVTLETCLQLARPPSVLALF